MKGCNARKGLSNGRLPLPVDTSKQVPEQDRAEYRHTESQIRRVELVAVLQSTQPIQLEVALHIRDVAAQGFNERSGIGGSDALPGIERLGLG